jgi:FkbM family methyltransferase
MDNPEKIYNKLKERFPKGLSRVIELGANNGQTARDLFSLLGVHEAYYAFEPDKRFWMMLQEQATNNPKFEFCCLAVSNVDGKIPFWRSYGQHSSGYVFADSSSILEPTQTIRKQWPGIDFFCPEYVWATMLDTFFAETPQVDLMWADVQGAELKVIEGGMGTLRNTHYLYTEFNEKEYYKGCPNLKQILNALPDWELVENYGTDALLRNKKWLIP